MVLPNNIDLSQLNGLSEKEKEYALQILKELSSKGNSEKFNDLLYGDYDEIPVDIETFLHNPKYLGKGLVNEEGKFTVFPYWVETLKKIFPTNIDTAYNTVILSGAIGLGKSFVAVICMLYMLYRMLCLKDPYLHYGLQPIDKITFSLMNITMDAAKGVAWDKLQQLLQSSEWFMNHGRVSKSLQPEWQPEKGIELIYGSQPRHVIGRAVYCLDGDTKIATTEGVYKLNELVNKPIKVFTYDDAGDITISDTCTVMPTIESAEEYQIELEDGSVIKCTPNHKFMLTDGSYKEAQYLTLDDELMNVNRYGYVYKTIYTINKVYLNTPKQYYDVIEATPNHNFLISTDNDEYIVSHNCSFEDEISFIQNQDITKQKEKAKALISSIEARMTSRFMKGEKLPTLHLIASSKRTDQSFLETYIDNKRKNNSKTTLIIDEPQWVIRTDKDSPNKFYVAVGNKFLNSELVPLDATEADLQIYRNRGFSLIHVPMGYYENFVDDIDVALTDIAGISTSNSQRYISGVRWAEIKNDTRQNPFVKEVLEIGNGPEDTTQYYDYFDMSRVTKEYKRFPLYIHYDMSISGDKTGIAGTWIVRKTVTKDGNLPSRDLFFALAFSVSIKAPKGRQISFEKNRQFAYWLKEQGFNIKGISSDTFQSYDTLQALKSKGFNCDVVSVDRLTDKVCLPYQYFRSTIYEKRLDVYPTKLLTDEVIGLVRDGNGKIDHTSAGGGIDSKDQVDACCGSIWNASQHAEEFAFEFGESLADSIDVNLDGESLTEKQITVDFEEELNKMFDPLGNRSQRLNSDRIPDNSTNTQGNQETPKKQPSQAPQSMPFFAGDGILIW